MEDNRNSSANFMEEEKMKLLNLLQRHNEILSKRTDSLINKEKENAWLKLEEEFNSNNQIKRNVTSLKKVWNKLKYEAKTYKSKLRVDVTGTGGGPSRLKKNSILELVLVLIGRAYVGIENVPDCDAPVESDLVLEMNVNPSGVIFSPDVQHELKGEINETIIITQVEDTSNEAMEEITPQASSSQIQAASRRRSLMKWRKDELQNEKVQTEIVKQKLMNQKMIHSIEKRAEEKELFELEKKNKQQAVQLRSIILQKLESNKDVDPVLLKMILEN